MFFDDEVFKGLFGKPIFHGMLDVVMQTLNCQELSKALQRSLH